jgi:pimeloyl-ACP methyl ester carboxylesterase
LKRQGRDGGKPQGIDLSKIKVRKYGRPPFTVAVLHGGPGAPGYMAPVARELSSDRGVLEPLQTALTLEGQVDELRAVLSENREFPVYLIGSSWGAMLGFIFAALYSAFVKKLILVGSGPFEECYTQKIRETRLNRLGEEERREAESLEESLKDPNPTNKDALLIRMGKLFTKADTYDPITLDTEELEVSFDIFQAVWSEAEALRKTGELLKLGRQIRCPVVAIHGDHDPHPSEGVRGPLTPILKDFRFVLLKNCGHLPWIEREAREAFYQILKEEMV